MERVRVLEIVLWKEQLISQYDLSKTTIGRLLQVINSASAIRPGSALQHICLVEATIMGSMFTYKKM